MYFGIFQSFGNIHVLLDILGALAVKGKTNFTGYDSLYQATLIQNHEQN
jgi:hypothetical protein